VSAEGTVLFLLVVRHHQLVHANAQRKYRKTQVTSRPSLHNDDEIGVVTILTNELGTVASLVRLARSFVDFYAKSLLQNLPAMLNRFCQVSVAPLNSVPVGIASRRLLKLPAPDQIPRTPTPWRMPCLKSPFLRNRKSLRSNQERWSSQRS
jgi:hypothetical protein